LGNELWRNENPRRYGQRGQGPSVFRRQENGVVGEEKFDFRDREIRELDVLCVDDIVVAVIADE
jgi:hypothetical protein